MLAEAKRGEGPTRRRRQLVLMIRTLVSFISFVVRFTLQSAKARLAALPGNPFRFSFLLALRGFFVLFVNLFASSFELIPLS